MKLSQKQFEILVCVEIGKTYNEIVSRLQSLWECPEEEIAEDFNILLDNMVLNTKGDNYFLSDRGYKVLEPYKVEKAIFFAAGLGSRMEPVTSDCPKPLVKVNGQSMIQTLLDAVVKVGIQDITVVVGHLADQFDELKEKYPMIEFVYNKNYACENNISSAYIVRDKLSNSYVLESDLVLYNPEIIRKYEYSSNYIGYKTQYTDDWCFKVDGKYIKQVLIGGSDVYHMYGISYWSEEDGLRLSKDIATVYESDAGKQKYWDEVALRDYKDKYNIMIRPVLKEDIVEIDSYEELKSLDDSYE